jgi:hypothetical protein
VQSGIANKCSENDMSILLNIWADLYVLIGDSISATRKAREAVEYSKINHKRNNPLYANAVMFLVRILADTGDIKSARELVVEALSLYESSFGISDPETLIAYEYAEKINKKSDSQL